jgi:hypothetical protein
MNAENFADYLKDYSKLYQLPYEELKSLVLQYPYCSNLHYLLAEKSQLDQHKDLDQHIQTAAYYSMDRAALRRLLQKLKIAARQMENFELAEDYLELKDLSVIEKEVDPLVSDDLLSFDEEGQESIPDLFSSLTEVPEESETLSVEEGLEADSPSYSFDPSLPNDSIEEEPSRPDPEKAGEALEDLFGRLISETPAADNAKDQAMTEETEEQETQYIEQTDLSPIPHEEWLNLSEETSAPPAQEKEEETEQSDDPMETPKELPNRPQPTPKSSFTSWVQQFQPTHVKVQLSELMESKKREDAKQSHKKKKKKKKKDKVVMFAERSLKERKDLASETLAELLVSQEQYDKAIEMYKRLILKFPEKSSYFADKIKNLKNQ